MMLFLEKFIGEVFSTTVAMDLRQSRDFLTSGSSPKSIVTERGGMQAFPVKKQQLAGRCLR
jgi:hypothetical protein